MSEEHTKESLAWGIVDPKLDPVQWFKEHLSHGEGDIHCVWIPSHPKTGGEHPRPEHAVLLAITGNGPKSEANAKRIVDIWMTHDIIISAGHNTYAQMNNLLVEVRSELNASQERVAQEHELYLTAHRDNMKAALIMADLREKLAASQERVRVQSEREAKMSSGIADLHKVGEVIIQKCFQYRHSNQELKTAIELWDVLVVQLKTESLPSPTPSAPKDEEKNP